MMIQNANDTDTTAAAVAGIINDDRVIGWIPCGGWRCSE
jgi:hypothetical protein